MTRIHDQNGVGHFSNFILSHCCIEITIYTVIGWNRLMKITCLSTCNMYFVVCCLCKLSINLLAAISKCCKLKCGLSSAVFVSCAFVMKTMAK